MRRLFLTAAVVAAVVGLPPPRADAAFLVSLSQSGATTKTFDLDNAATVAAYFDVDDLGNGVTQYSLNGTVMVGDYKIWGSFVKTNFPGTPEGARLGIGNATVTRKSGTYGDPLTIAVTQTDFTLPTDNVMVGLTGSGNFGSGANPNASATLTSLVDLGNTAYGQNADSSQLRSASATLGTVGSGTGVEAFSNPFAITNPYSITTTMMVSGLGVGQSVSGLNAETLVHAPAPAGLVLAAGAVPILGLIRRRFREAPTPAV